MGRENAGRDLAGVATFLYHDARRSLLPGVFPYGRTICAGIKNAPCGDAGAGECKTGSESKPDVPCQYQMNEPNGTIEVVLLAK